MWEWYRIGLFLGLGTAIGAAFAGLFAPRRTLVAAVAVLAAVAAAAAGYAFFGWGEAVAGAIGGLIGTVAVSGVVAGTLGRGGARGRTAGLGLLARPLLALPAPLPVVRPLAAGRVPVVAAPAPQPRP